MSDHELSFIDLITSREVVAGGLIGVALFLFCVAFVMSVFIVRDRLDERKARKSAEVDTSDEPAPPVVSPRDVRLMRLPQVIKVARKQGITVEDVVDRHDISFASLDDEGQQEHYKHSNCAVCTWRLRNGVSLG